MAGEYSDLGEVGAVTPHRFGEAGVDRFAGVVIGAVQEEDWQSQLACVSRLSSVGNVGGGIHVPGIGTEEASAGERGGVDRQVFFGYYHGVAGNSGRLVRATKPAVVAADFGGSGGFATAGGIAFAKERTNGVFDVGLENGTGTVEMLVVKKLILPLAGGIRGFGIDLAVDERDQLGRGETLGNVRDAEIGDGLAALRMVAGEAP